MAYTIGECYPYGDPYAGTMVDHYEPKSGKSLWISAMNGSPPEAIDFWSYLRDHYGYSGAAAARGTLSVLKSVFPVGQLSYHIWQYSDSEQWALEDGAVGSNGETFYSSMDEGLNAGITRFHVEEPISYLVEYLQKPEHTRKTKGTWEGNPPFYPPYWDALKKAYSYLHGRNGDTIIDIVDCREPNAPLPNIDTLIKLAWDAGAWVGKRTRLGSSVYWWSGSHVYDAWHYLCAHAHSNNPDSWYDFQHCFIRAPDVTRMAENFSYANQFGLNRLVVFVEDPDWSYPISATLKYQLGTVSEQAWVHGWLRKFVRDCMVQDYRRYLGGDPSLSDSWSYDCPSMYYNPTGNPYEVYP